LSLKTKVLLIFLSTTLMLTLLLYYLINENLHLFDKKHHMESENLFYEITLASQDFLTSMIKSYENKKDEIIKAHQKALKYFKTHSLEENLSKIRSGFDNKYHFFITDTNYTIVNTTYPLDLNFSIEFAKETLQKHRYTIGISPPVCEPATARFFTYTDSSVPFGSKRILQLGYEYNQNEVRLFRTRLESFLKNHKNITEFTIYFVFPSIYFAQECNILKPPGKKPPLQHFLKVKKEILPIYKSLKTEKIISSTNKTSKNMYILTKNILNDQSSIIYKITFDESSYLSNRKKKIFFLFGILSFAAISILLFYFFITKKITSPILQLAKAIKEKRYADIKNKKESEIAILFQNYNHSFKEMQQSIMEKKKFLNHAIHELKTPLAVIALNNDMQKPDRYTQSIKTAIKQLRHAYDNMVFFQKLNRQNRNISCIDATHLLLERLEYFKEMASIEEKNLNIHCDEKLQIMMDKNDFTTLIDNNITNAIKYSVGNEINIKVSKGKIIFANRGNIQNIDRLKEDFYRENFDKGGFGIGLGIVLQICKKYNIRYSIRNIGEKVYFIYDFKEILCK